MPARSAALKRASKQVQEGFLKNGKPKMKTYWQCKSCLCWFRDIGSVEVDHVVEAGPFEGDWNSYIGRLWISLEDVTSLAVLCLGCHMKKTSKFNASLRYKRKSRDEELL